MTIAADVQHLSPGSLIELYEFDTSSLGGEVMRFHAHLQTGVITWQGVQYSPWPVVAQGFERTGGATQPAPTLTVSNLDGSISALCLLLGDCVGGQIRRHRTLSKYLDGQPGADPSAEMPVEVWYVEQKTGEDNTAVEFTLSSVLDFSGRQLPNRQVIAHLCPAEWVYRGPICGYRGTAYFDANNNPVTDPTKDVCGRRLSSCKCRFGANNPLPFGGFPAAGTAGTL
ncbi:phage minor tail protein L [Burkholderia cenocepacia]|uniref:phage minor tail protein L n=1 Tax=Burkholderia cenocepacia TaxID=95486 RepID=UPI0024B80AEC|nr:phage minor tail protein L [Burkholderia cenocepacia]MDI9686560.1 phage minor tail protein L [Burkholderia cenocepacia]